MQLTTSQWMIDGKRTDKGRVLYVYGEGGSGLGRRVSAHEEHYGQPITDAFIWQPSSPDLYRATDADFAEVVKVAVDLKPDLIWFDTLAKNAVGAEENSARDMTIVVDRMEQLRRATGATVCAIHHTGKDLSAGMRGSNSLIGNVDTNVMCEGAGDRLTITVTKQKNGPKDTKTHFRMKKVGESLVVVDAVLGDAESDELLDSDRKALASLSEVEVPGGTTSTVWLEVSELPKSTFYRCVKKLLDQKLVTNVGTETRPRYVISPSPT